MERISEAVVSKTRVEAQGIIREAEEKARKEIENAKKERGTRFAAEKERRLQEAEEEAARIIAQGSVKGHQKLSSTKADIIAQMIKKVKETLAETGSDESHLVSLITEAIDALGADKGRIYVSPKDVSTVEGFLKGNSKLSSRIVEVREFACTGGVIAEDMEGKFRIDNTYDTRLEMLLPKLLPEINRSVFELNA